MTDKTSKHDKYVLELYKKVQSRYDYLILDYEISTKKRRLGQIDLCGVKDGRTDIYEVKCSPRFHKARKQLVKAQRLMQVRGDLFFYCGSSGMIHDIAVD